MVSLPYTVHISRITVVPGDEVTAGEEIAQVRSPDVDNIVATYMRSLADVSVRQAELRVKARGAQGSLEAARAYQHLTEEAADRLEASTAASLSFRIEIHRERALAQKGVASQEAEIAEATVQLEHLSEFETQLRSRLKDAESNFAAGRVIAPTSGIISTSLARVGQSLVAGTPIAEIFHPTDVYVDWYVPNERLADPRVGNEVVVLFGNWRLSGKITDILPISDVYAGTALLSGGRIATQIARIRFDPGTQPPALNSTVYVHMHYTTVTAYIGDMLVRFFGLGRA